MLSVDRIYEIIEQTWGSLEIAPPKATAFARAIEREATAEATRIMREWREAFLAWRAYGASPEGNMQDLDALYRSMDRAAQACVDYLERMNGSI